ncbi:PD-(D/E)XK nuclease family protein [Acinetobacter baylyi]|uniref:PD-(D/E)XK nuclease family protein n=1 Tax=Acinetobacter baylyi TaxID=202950 RepID=UPI0031E142E0
MQEIEDQLIQKYKYLLLEAQQYKKPEREMTIFDTALKNHHENPITELLAFFLNPNNKHQLEDCFYQGLITALKQYEQYKDFDFGEFKQLSTQQVTTQGKFIDLWVETDNALIIVEVKVYHHQNNPFKEYEAWANKKIDHQKRQDQEKRLISIVLCPNGKCTIANWLGLSYTQLATSTRKHVSQYAFNQTLNKWAVFAREFLLHLESFNHLLDIDMIRLNFVVDNMYKIQELIDLKQSVFRDVIRHINTELQIALGDDYRPEVKEKNWRSGPAFYLSGLNWKDASSSILYLRLNDKPMSCSVRMYVHRPTSELRERIKELLDESKYLLTSEWDEQNGKWWCLKWDFSEFDLDTVTNQIIFTHKILNRVELEWKNRAI